jgi:hypothetical protein
MSTTTETFERNGVYHSDLVNHGEILIKLTSGPRDSKYKGKLPWVGFRVDGDDKAYTLNIENDAIKADLEACPLETWLLVKASGRGDGAFLIIEDRDGNPLVPGTVTATAPVTVVRPAPVATDKVAQAFALTMQAYSLFADEGIIMDGSSLHALYATHYIQLHR